MNFLNFHKRSSALRRFIMLRGVPTSMVQLWRCQARAIRCLHNEKLPLYYYIWQDADTKSLAQSSSVDEAPRIIQCYMGRLGRQALYGTISCSIPLEISQEQTAFYPTGNKSSDSPQIFPLSKPLIIQNLLRARCRRRPLNPAFPYLRRTTHLLCQTFETQRRSNLNFWSTQSSRWIWELQPWRVCLVCQWPWPLLHRRLRLLQLQVWIWVWELAKLV